GARELTQDPVLWLACALSLFGGWLVTLFVNLFIGCLAFFLESSAKVMDLYLAAFFVMSGYLMPLALFPEPVRRFGDYLPFRYQIGLPVELMTGVYDGHRAVAFTLLGQQAIVVAALAGLTALAWVRGLRRFEAYGG
ncbi:MAG: ABC-2 family transporter protein, partial [Polyangiaceae bacterium]